MSENDHPHSHNKSFDKLAATIEAVYKTREPGDDKEALLAILNSMESKETSNKKPNVNSSE